VEALMTAAIVALVASIAASAWAMRKSQADESEVMARLVSAGLVEDGTEAGAVGLEMADTCEFTLTLAKAGQTTAAIKDRLNKALPLWDAYAVDATQEAATRWHIRFITDDPFEALRIDYRWEHPAEHFEQPDLHALPVAKDSEGSIICADATLHSLTSAVSGAGKSGLMNAVIASLSYCHCAAIFGIDLKAGLELMPWQERMTSLAPDVTEAIGLLTEIDDIMRQRFAYMKQHGMRKVEPSPDFPLIFVAIDEIAQLKGANKKETERIEHLLRSVSTLGRAAAVTLWVATQRPSVDAIPGGDAVRGNLIARYALKLANAEQVKIVLGNGYEVDPLYNPVSFPPGSKGLCLFTVPAQRLGKVIYVSDGDVSHIVANTAHLRIPAEILRC
jgi:S-DNA-T family DNA segregation ATPase FtsK/SpoIIIE